MIIEGNWTAKSEPIHDNNDLTHLVYRYDLNLDIKITNPFVIKY